MIVAKSTIQSVLLMLLYSYIAKSATKTRIDRWREIQVIVDLSICRFLPERVGLNFRTVFIKNKTNCGKN